jgi:glycosyltransferase involved in cell wall biosynthesis
VKSLHVTFGFLPDPVGGTEVYVEALARRLRSWGMPAIVAAPGVRSERYLHDGLTVYRFAIGDRPQDLAELYGEGDAGAAAEFGALLDDERPDLVHLHAFTRGVSLRLVREARARGMPVVFTYHTPTVSCQRGTLMRWGEDVCDGRLDRAMCSACALHGLGVGLAASRALGRVPPGLGRALGQIGASGGAWTALRTSELVRRRHATTRALFEEVGQIVALCDWARDVLLRNGVPAWKITQSRHGVEGWVGGRPGPQLDAREGPLRIVFLGRLHPTKGADTLVRAVRALAGRAIELDLYGAVGMDSADRYAGEVRRLATGDPRIRLLPGLPHGEILRALAGYHLVAVPSRWLETGPLVVLEAFAAGVPVIGSRLGGIVEVVSDGVDGLLVEASSVKAWSDAIRQVDESRETIDMLRHGIREPRNLDDVAADMVDLYRRLRPKRRSAGRNGAMPASAVTAPPRAASASVGRTRILYVQFTNPAGYPPLEHSARLLADAGWQVRFLGTGALGAGRLEFRLHARIRVERLPFVPGGWRQKVSYARFLLRAVAVALMWRPRWIYASDSLACPAALLLSLLPGIKVVYHEHDSPAPGGGSCFQRLTLSARKVLARRAALCVLPNQQRAEAFADLVGGKSRVLCVWNCPTRDEVTLPRRPGEGSDLWLLYQGSIVPERLPLSAVRALALVPDRVKLRVIGYETLGHLGYVDTLRRAAAECGVTTRVEFMGPMARHDLLRWCRQADVGLAFLPKCSTDMSLCNMLGASNKPFDYLASGLALLVSDLPDWRTTFVEAGYGRCCDSDDATSIGEALRWFLDHPQERRRMGERGRQMVLKEWNYEGQFAPVMHALSG